MAVRLASLVCCLGLTMGIRVAGAQNAANGSSAPSAATSGPAPSTPTVVESAATSGPAPSTPAVVVPRRSTETDDLGRSKWWPAPPGNSSRPASLQRSGEQGTAQSEPLLPFEEGILFLPYLGLSIPLGDDSGNYTVGHTFGALIGVHFVRGFSLNMEINVDYMSPGPLATETQIDYALSPLLQSSGPRHLWVFGMKFGRYSLSRSVAGINDYGSSETSYSTTGFVWGVTIGGFVPVGPLAVGGLARINVRQHSSNCKEGSSGSLCKEDTRYGVDGVSPAFATFNFSVAVLF